MVLDVFAIIYGYTTSLICGCSISMRVILRSIINTHGRIINQCVKSVQIRSFFWSVFSDQKYGLEKIRTRKNSVFGLFSRSKCLPDSEQISSNNDTCVLIKIQ